MMFGGDHKLGSFVFANESERSFERAADRAVNAEVRQIFDNARHFDSVFPVLNRWAAFQGWRIAFVDGKWVTQSRAPQTMGINGPRFDTFGDLIQWLFEQVEKQNDDLTPE